MGRWAQAQRTGSKSPSELQPADMIQVSEEEDDQARVTYNRTIDPTALAPEDFQSIPSGAKGTSLIQTAPTEIQITFNDIIAGDERVEYEGTTPGFKTPDDADYI